VTGPALRLHNRVILVTGAARGIGRATCQRLASEGAKVVCADLDAKGAAVTADAIGDVAMFVECDVTDERSAQAAVAAAITRFGSLYGLMNNAAAPSTDATVIDLALADWQREISVSLTGAFLMSKFAIPHMTNGGSIIHVASQFARVAITGSAAYCAAKAGLVNLAKVMALDHAGQNIRVNTLSPGAVATERLVAFHGSLAEAERKLAPKHPLGRIAQPEEIAAAAAFLMSDDSSFMTGADLLIDGGYAAP
jgi:NAD(P)-dependent dehydrogenase (short-subunit alcohol dehydrogenase family)